MSFCVSCHFAFHVILRFMSFGVSFIWRFMSFGVSCHLAFHVILVIIVIIVTKVLNGINAKVFIEDRCVFKKWLLLLLDSHRAVLCYKSSFGANKKNSDSLPLRETALNLPNENLLIWYNLYHTSPYQVDINNQLLETLHDIHGFSCLGTVKKAIKIHQKCIFQPLHNEVKSVLDIKESYSMGKKS